MYKSKEKDWLYDELIPLLRVSQCRQTRWHTKDGKSSKYNPFHLINDFQYDNTIIYIPDYQSLRDYKFFKKDQINYALRRFAPGELPHRVGYLRMEPDTMKLSQSAKETIVRSAIYINCNMIFDNNFHINYFVDIFRITRKSTFLDK